MERIIPFVWAAFGFAFASAIYLPKPGAGAFAVMCALLLFALGIIAETDGRKR